MYGSYIIHMFLAINLLVDKMGAKKIWLGTNLEVIKNMKQSTSDAIYSKVHIVCVVKNHLSL